jgi:tetratricopeptide (TPR) repeat protein
MSRFRSVIPLAAFFLFAWSFSVWADGEKDAKKEVAFGNNVAQRGLWREARFRFEQATILNPDSAAAFNNLGVTLEQQGEFEKARAAYDRALQLDPRNVSIQQNYDLFREADEKRNRKLKKDAPPKPKETATPGPVIPTPVVPMDDETEIRR